MTTEHQKNLKKLLNLNDASARLGVSPEVLLEWNEHNILKPTITQTGEIGYVEEQIMQFLAIRQLAQAGVVRQEQEIVASRKDESSDYADNTVKIDGSSYIQETKGEKVKAIKHFSPLLGFSVLGIVLFVSIALFSQLKTGFLYVNDDSIKAQKSNLDFEDATISKHPISLKEDADDDFGEIFTASSILSHVLRSGEDEAEATQRPSLFDSKGLTFSPSSVETYASVGGPGKEDLAIDEDGNIVGEPKSDVFATTIDGIGGVLGSQIEDERSSVAKQILLLMVTLAGGSFLFRKQLSYAFSGHVQAHNALPVANIDAPAQKVLEVDQKMDGTVVIRLLDKEYRLSRPELYSESDHFIQRLMELTRNGEKEIDYQSLNDDEIRLSAPLSKLVTRLGFVGIKRDLFFPRTSKDRVLFRKYLTEADLEAMSLPIDEISSGLIKQV